MDWLLVLPLMLPLVNAVLLMAIRDRWPAWQRGLGIAGPALMLVLAAVLWAAVWSGGIRATQVGNWPAPLGITLVADLLAATLVLVVAVVGTPVAVVAACFIARRRLVYGFFPLLQILMLGLNGAFLAGDVFNLYVWFETLLIASFVLMALGSERPQLEGTVFYFSLNFVGSLLLLGTIGYTYGIVGTLNMADMATRLDAIRGTAAWNGLAMLYFSAFGLKAAVFPLFFWLPASYHTPPAAVSAIFAGLLTKVGVYGLIRAFTLLFVPAGTLVEGLLLGLGMLTMLTGVLGALSHSHFRRILAFHSISQIGYMVTALGFQSAAGLAAAVVFVVHHSVVKSNLFLVAGNVHRLYGREDVYHLGGLITSQRLLAVLFFVTAMSLAGIPPLSGFLAKLMVVRSGLEQGQGLAVAVALGVGLLTLMSMVKIWSEAFWKEPPEDMPRRRALSTGQWWFSHAAIGFLALLAVGLGLAAGPVVAAANEVAAQLLDRAAYLEAVLGSQAP